MSTHNPELLFPILLLLLVGLLIPETLELMPSTIAVVVLKSVNVISISALLLSLHFKEIRIKTLIVAGNNIWTGRND